MILNKIENASIKNQKAFVRYLQNGTEKNKAIYKDKRNYAKRLISKTEKDA